MRRPRKTRLRWMMEMPGMGAPPHAAAPHDLPKHIRYLINKKICFNSNKRWPLRLKHIKLFYGVGNRIIRK